MKGKWTLSEEQQLISMRAEDKIWEEISAVNGRNHPSLKKRFYGLNDNGSEKPAFAPDIVGNDVEEDAEGVTDDAVQDPANDLAVETTIYNDPAQDGDSSTESEDDETSQPRIAPKRAVLPLLPLEKVGKVPCVNADRGCKKLFATYQAAHQHDNKDCSKEQTTGPFVCKWPNCDKKFGKVEGVCCQSYDTRLMLPVSQHEPYRRGWRPRQPATCGLYSGRVAARLSIQVR